MWVSTKPTFLIVAPLPVAQAPAPAVHAVAAAALELDVIALVALDVHGDVSVTASLHVVLRGAQELVGSGAQGVVVALPQSGSDCLAFPGRRRV